MVEPISTGLVVAIILLVKSAPSWLPCLSDTFGPPIRNALIGKEAERVFDKGLGVGRKWLHLDDKEQTRHLELALKNAAERGLAQFHTKEEQEQYRDILTTLSKPDSNIESLRSDALGLFTLSDPSDDFKNLNGLYKLVRTQTQSTPTVEVDAIPYLRSFFDALIAEFYADPYFTQQMNNALHVRAAMSMQRSLTEIVSTLHQIGETLVDNYKVEQFEKDIKAYTEHIERTLRYLKLVGVVPKERSSDNRDPELDGMFVPLHIALKELQLTSESQTRGSIIDFLEHTPCLTLLGDPGSGKSTATRHLAWSHAVANLSNSTSVTSTLLLSGKPLPLRIELRRLSEDRKQRPDYDFLTYASEVLLGRAGLDTPPLMFELLLERRAMLILLDGLDEVATLDDRRRLVDEIESFAQRYPGNRFLITSRPVGYELVPIFAQLFSQAYIQPFDDQQIHLFLEHWYAHVLGISPLLPNDQQELEALYTTLKENGRLHSLAKNPLLLTVITALHRYERLPDRRILVYDRCADLLLETWAKLKGTNARWNDLKLSKEDQYACVAHLGFVLHKRSQVRQKDNTNADGEETSSTDGLITDVSSRFMLREIEGYLQSQNLFPSIAEQHTQAKRFLELIQEEAGLIVERGCDVDGELLYAFVHRTFQEYFAAADLYERYQQEEEPAIISEFLREHLHDLHWREVILLILGKLKRKPATAQLRHILESKNKYLHSHFVNPALEDLFFVSFCLIEEISIENDLAQDVISQLGNFVKGSSLLSRCSEVLETLGDLMRTRQYAVLAHQELMEIVDSNQLVNIIVKIAAIITIFQNSTTISKERQLAYELLLQLAQRPDLPVERSLQAAETLSLFTPIGSGARQFIMQWLSLLFQRSDLPIDQFIQTILNLCRFSPVGSAERKIASRLLLELAQRTDLPTEQFIQVVRIIVRFNLSDSKKDMPLLASFAKEERPSARVRDHMHQVLRNMVHQYHDIEPKSPLN